MSARNPSRLATLSLCSALWLAAGAAQAADVALNPQEQRITDQAVQTDLKGLQALQDRIARINAGGMAADNYYLVKAQSWLDFATHEYHENDRSQVIEQALGQSLWLVTQLEGGISGITLDTPVIPESQRLREDLWKIAAELKQHQGFSCAAAPLAEMEVRLVWAGHENKELGWRHAREHFAAAERLARRAQKLADNCICPPEAPKPCVNVETPVVAPPPVVVAPEPVKPPVVNLLANVPRNIHFGLDKSEITPVSARVLKRVAEILMTYPAMNIVLEGHTDARASQAYNLKLSKRRVDAVSAHLVKLGVLPERISTYARGMEKTLNDEQDVLVNHALSRRVEIHYQGVEIESYALRDDLQVETAKAKAAAKGKAKPKARQGNKAAKAARKGK
jgi:outer membrane protein OmpA-like peptidoglycan-associated protein